MDLKDFLLPGGLVMLMVLIVLSSSFMFGAINGADASKKPNVTATDRVEEMEDQRPKIMEDVRDNISTKHQRVALKLIGSYTLIRWAVDASIHGIRFGYQYPNVAVTAGRYWDFIMMGAIGIYLFQIYREVFG